MKKTILIFLTMAVTVFAGNFEDGLEAAQDGDNKMAAALWQKAADQGDVRAQVKLGRMYTRGWLGVKQDNNKAAALYQKAADQGNADAQFKLGGCTTMG